MYIYIYIYINTYIYVCIYNVIIYYNDTSNKEFIKMQL